jgi:hypothetical protein
MLPSFRRSSARSPKRSLRSLGGYPRLHWVNAALPDRPRPRLAVWVNHALDRSPSGAHPPAPSPARPPQESGREATSLVIRQSGGASAPRTNRPSARSQTGLPAVACSILLPHLWPK